MIQAALKATVFLAFLTAITTPFSACTKKVSAPTVANNRPQLAELFESLYLGTYGLDYPSTEMRLQSCRANNDAACLQVYERVISAARELKATKSDLTLTATPETIRSTCGSEAEVAANFICHGALASLYFYNDPEFDSRILKFIETLPISTQSEILNTSFAWFHNRPTPQQWLEYISRASIQWQTESSKEYVESQFASDATPPHWAKE